MTNTESIEQKLDRIIALMEANWETPEYKKAEYELLRESMKYWMDPEAK